MYTSKNTLLGVYIYISHIQRTLPQILRKRPKIVMGWVPLCAFPNSEKLILTHHLTSSTCTGSVSVQERCLAKGDQNCCTKTNKKRRLQPRPILLLSVTFAVAHVTFTPIPKQAFKFPCLQHPTAICERRLFLVDVAWSPFGPLHGLIMKYYYSLNLWRWSYPDRSKTLQLRLLRTAHGQSLPAVWFRVWGKEGKKP